MPMVGAFMQGAIGGFGCRARWRRRVSRQVEKERRRRLPFQDRGIGGKNDRMAWRMGRFCCGATAAVAARRSFRRESRRKNAGSAAAAIPVPPKDRCGQSCARHERARILPPAVAAARCDRSSAPRPRQPASVQRIMLGTALVPGPYPSVDFSASRLRTAFLARS